MPANGLLTDTDRNWLSGAEKNKSNRKRECQERLAMAMTDIKFLCELNTDTTSNLDSFGTLFEKISEDHIGGEEFDHREAATHLIAVAYMMVNDSIDYESISKETKLNSDGSLGNIQPIDDLLAFREALADGIKLGREKLEPSENDKYLDNDDIPERVLVNSNTRLYEPPIKGDLDGTENYKGGNEQRQGAANVSDNKILDPEPLNSDVAVQIDLAVSQAISRRHATADIKGMDRQLE
ncbi:hypothetical protein [Natrarchaeobius oligotrophus]|uniref:hypothetical protein n=1 Tax=Natrarchaeobius oligotrophus TaxID=3455743 RepID=UPI000F53BA6E|nr:hypothetical protein [Natrarchaeobius chitinivorans]